MKKRYHRKTWDIQALIDYCLPMNAEAKAGMRTRSKEVLATMVI